MVPTPTAMPKPAPSTRSKCPERGRAYCVSLLIQAHLGWGEHILEDGQTQVKSRWEPPHLCGGRSALALRERVSTLNGLHSIVTTRFEFLNGVVYEDHAPTRDRRPLRCHAGLLPIVDSAWVRAQFPSLRKLSTDIPPFISMDPVGHKFRKASSTQFPITCAPAMPTQTASLPPANVPTPCLSAPVPPWLIFLPAIRTRWSSAQI